MQFLSCQRHRYEIQYQAQEQNKSSFLSSHHLKSFFAFPNVCSYYTLQVQNISNKQVTFIYHRIHPILLQLTAKTAQSKYAQYSNPMVEGAYTSCN